MFENAPTVKITDTNWQKPNKYVCGQKQTLWLKIVSEDSHSWGRDHMSYDDAVKKFGRCVIDKALKAHREEKSRRLHDEVIKYDELLREKYEREQSNKPQGSRP